MRVAAWLLAAVLALTATACSSGKSSSGDSPIGKPSPARSSQSDSKTMPDVTGKNLQVAEDAIEAAGGDPGKITVIGGGKFGVAVKSNWQVCSQSPSAGEALPAAPQLTIERSCSDSSASPSTSASASPTTSESGTAAPLTVRTSKDLAALVKVGSYCDPTVKTFAEKYAGQEIEFDGSIVALNKHGSYNTRYDIGIAPGDKGASSTDGPFFQFQDVNTITDLHYKGSVPDSIGIGSKLHLVAQVGDYNSKSCLFQLTPVSTRVR